jgi:uncharacterized protein
MTVSLDAASTHAVTWQRYEQRGAEFAEFSLGARRLAARSTAIGAEPVPYRLELEFCTGDDFVTSSLVVETRGLGWRRRLDLHRSKAGVWSATVAAEGAVDLAEPGGDMDQFEGALDPDVELSPVLNTPPTLRHRLLAGGAAPELVMVWVELPSLALHRSVQRYSYRGLDAAGNHVVHFEAPDPDGGGFAEDIVFDADGIVVDYPGIAKRIGSADRHAITAAGEV